MDAQDPVPGVGVVHHVERAVAGGHDRRVVDDVRPGDLDERAVPGSGHRARLEVGQREPVRPRCRDAGGAEVRRAGEVYHGRAEPVLLRRGAVEGDRLHRGRVADRDVGQLGRVVHAQVVGQPDIGGVQQDVPDLLGVRGARVRAHRLGAEINLEGAFQGQVIPGQQPAELPQPVGRARDLVRRGGRGGRRGPPAHGNSQRRARGQQGREHGCRPASSGEHRSEHAAIHGVSLFS